MSAVSVAALTTTCVFSLNQRAEAIELSYTTTYEYTNTNSQEGKLVFEWVAPEDTFSDSVINIYELSSITAYYEGASPFPSYSDEDFLSLFSGDVSGSSYYFFSDELFSFSTGNTDISFQFNPAGVTPDGDAGEVRILFDDFNARLNFSLASDAFGVSDEVVITQATTTPTATLQKVVPEPSLIIGLIIAIPAMLGKTTRKARS